MYYVLLATALVGVVGIVIGLLLGVAGEKFKVEEDEREIAVEEILPGNNCGGCGYAGCSAMAKAIVAGEAPINGCPSCSQEIVTQISRILGVDSVATVRKAAFVKCAGTCDKTEVKFRYYGVEDCQGAMAAPGGGYKSCSWGCLRCPAAGRKVCFRWIRRRSAGSRCIPVVFRRTHREKRRRTPGRWSGSSGS